MARHKLRALTFAVVLVTSMAVSGLAGVGSVGTVAAQDETQVRTCDDPVSIAVGAVVGFGKGGFDGATSEENPCIKTENIADADTTEEAKRVIAQEAMEDRRYWRSYANQFDTYSGEIQNPAYSDARITFVEAVANGSDRIEAVTEARRAAHARTSSQQRELWVYYTSMVDALGTLESKAEDKGVRGDSIRIGHVNASGNFKTGYTAQQSATTNVTATNGSKVTVPALVNEANSSDTLNPLDDDVLVRVWNPEAGGWIEYMNTGTFSRSAGDTIADPADSQTIDLAKKHKVTWELNTTADPDHAATAKIGGGKITLDEGSTDGEYFSEIIGPDGNTLVDFTSASHSGNPSFSVTWDSGTATLSAAGQSASFETSDSKLELTPAANSDVVNMVYYDQLTSDSYTNQFGEKHQHLEQVDNDVITGLGNSSSGYLSDVFDAYENGEINITESLWEYDRTRMAPDEMQSTATQNLARERLGLGRSSSGSSASVTVHAGAVVNGETIDSDTTYDAATLWATSPPPNASWEANTTLSVSDVGGLAGLNYEATNSYQENGTVKYETVTRMANIESGTFTVNSLTTSDGQDVTVIEHDDNNPESTNVSDLNTQIEELSEAIELYRDQLENETAGVGGGAGGGGGGIDLSIPGLGSFSLPWDSMAINLGAIGMLAAGGAVVVFVAGPTGRLISLIWKVSSGGGRAAEKVAGVTNARRRGLERYRER